MLRDFADVERWWYLLLEEHFAELYRFLERHTFEKVPIYQAYGSNRLLQRLLDGQFRGIDKFSNSETTWRGVPL
jgi:hypothetical protein